MIRSRRRAIFLVEMLTVFLCVAIGGTLMTVGLASIVRSHRQIAGFANRYAVLNDFLQWIRHDVRTAEEITLRGGEGGDLQKVLVIGESPRQVLYRFYPGRVERVGFEDDTIADKYWEMKHTDVTIGVEQAGGSGDTVLNMTVQWHRSSKITPEPRRRFDITIRCSAAQVEYEHDG